MRSSLKHRYKPAWRWASFCAASVLLIVVGAGAHPLPTDLPETGPDIIQPEELVKLLQSKAEKPLLLQVGSHVLYAQAHIPGSEYLGSASSDNALHQLRKRVQSLPRDKSIVIYCGCCPWKHCPNVQPAYDALRSMVFTSVKVLHLANNFGADWVDKGYPVAKGD